MLSGMKWNQVCLIGLLLMGGEMASGNGGGYYRPGVGTTGGITGFEPVATEHVRILDETLLIRAGLQSTKVEVRYLMRNMTNKKVKVRFGFPIEETKAEVEFYDQPAGHSVPASQKSPAYCKDYQITARGKPLRVRWQTEENPDEDRRFNGLSGWNVSEITFSQGEEVPVTIRFESEYPEQRHFVSDVSSTSASIFRYRLSTAACWHGTIAEGRVIVEPDGIDPRDIRVIKPVNRFKKEGERWIWNFKDLEPTLDDDLEIECQPAVQVYGEQPLAKERDEQLPGHLYAEYVDRGGHWSMMHSNFDVSASSTHPPEGGVRYDAVNVRDQWESSAWSEGVEGSGAGEWLEMIPKAAKPLIDIRIKPGYQKTTDDGLELFKANARPKKIRVELNGEHRFDTEIPDREEEVVIPVRGYDKPVKRIRLTFADVYPGELFEDLCVTGVKLHARLDREPDIRPQR